MAKLLKSDGTIMEVEPKNGHDFSLEELQVMVGGIIDLIKFRTGRWLVVNDDGRNLGLPLNAFATLLYRLNGGDFIVGDAVLCESWQIE